MKLSNLSKKKVLLFFSSFLLTVLLNISCNEDQNSNEDETIDQTQLERTHDKVRVIFYSLPSPIEVSMVLESCGAEYVPSLLNPTNNIDRYNTSFSMAINLGIYGADLSYASINKQAQSTLNYMSASLKLSEELGILEAITDDQLKIISDSINNHDAILHIISETFMKSNSYLEENSRPEIAAAIISGGWLEGLYIGSQLAIMSDRNTDLINHIIGQKYALEDLLGLLSIYNDDKNIKQIIKEIKSIQIIYETLDNTNNKVQFTKLCEKVASIRNKYIE